VNVLILAAGLGTRLRPLTDKFPKPCVPFLNVPMGLYPFRYLESLAISQLTVNTHHLPGQVRALYQNQPYYSGPVKFSHEEEIILGSAGGLKQASRFFADSIENTILMLNSVEIFFGADPLFLAKAYEQHLRLKSLATLVVMKHPQAGKKFGAIWCDGTTVRAIGKTTSTPGLNPFHYVGMIFLDKKILDVIPGKKELNIFYDVLIPYLQDGSAHIYEVFCEWFETGIPADYLSATETVLSNLDSSTLQFINRYDRSSIVKYPGGVSLISDVHKGKELKLDGYNVISKTTNPDLLKNPGLISNSILFGNEKVNENYFKV
jgi:mannose-1-phosphate guanylyltransferase